MKLMFKVLTVIILSLFVGAHNVQASKESVLNTKQETLFYTSWVSQECDISGEMPNELVTRLASKLDIKTDFVFRIDSQVKLFVSIACYSKVDPIYLIDVHFEKYNAEKGFEYVGKVYVRQYSAIQPIYLDKDSLFHSLKFVVNEAIADFYSENQN
jgi:hypothetical protein